MAYGIDSEISARADAYSNNPQALQNQYKKSGSVLDLIALERIRKELETKRQEVALQMQGDPKTVAEQTLDETKGLIQKDVTDQTSKLLTQTKKAQDSRLRKLAAGRRPNAPLGIPAAAQRRGTPNQQQLAGIGNVPPRSPVNPRGTGIAANRLPSTAYGARGGIVSFAQGGIAWSDLSPEQQGRTTLTEAQWNVISEGAKNRWVEHFADHPDPSEYTLDEERGRMRDMSIMSAIKEHGKTRPWAHPFSYFTDSAAEREAKIQGRAETDPYVESMRSLLRGGEGVPGKGIWNVPPADDAVTPPDPNAVPPVPPVPTQTSTTTTSQDLWAGYPDFLRPQFDEAAPNTTFQGMLAKLGSGLVDRDYTQEPITGLPDTTALSADVDPLRPKTAAEMGVGDREADLRAAQKKLTGDVEGIAAQDVAQAWKDKVTAGEDVFGRAGVAGEYDKMAQARRDLYDEQTAGRADSRAYDLLARAGGMGALSNIGRAAADMNEADLQRAVMQLTDVQGVQERGLDRDYSMANAIITSADATEKNVTQAIANANNVREKILSTESKELTDLANNWMKADVATMEAGDRRLRMKFDALMEKYGAEVTQRGQNLTAQLANERNAISVLSTLAVSEAQRDELIVRVEDLVRKIDTDYATIAQSAIDQILLTEAYEDADDKGKQTMKDEIRKEFKLMARDMAEQFRKAVKEARGEGFKVTQ